MSDYIIHHTNDIYSVIFAFFVFGLTGWLLVKTDALRDTSTAKDKPYSFSRVQLLWWTLVVVCSELIVLFVYGKLLNITTTCLELMGISLAATTTGRVIDNNQINDPNTNRHQDHESEGFVSDIMSDENGMSVHRFQAVIFNVVYGIVFLLGTIKNSMFPEFDTQTISLLGLSSGAYLAMKITEKSTPPSSGNKPPPAG